MHCHSNIIFPLVWLHCSDKLSSQQLSLSHAWSSATINLVTDHSVLTSFERNSNFTYTQALIQDLHNFQVCGCTVYIYVSLTQATLHILLLIKRSEELL